MIWHYLKNRNRYSQGHMTSNVNLHLSQKLLQVEQNGEHDPKGDLEKVNLTIVGFQNINLYSKKCNFDVT